MEMILLIGIPGAGKSTFYQERFAETHIHINLDTLKTRRREMALVTACLVGGLPCVVDNTNVSAAERARYIPLARQAGWQVVGYYFLAGLEEAQQRNRQRTGKALVPEKGLRSRWRLLEPPRLDEGFDRLYSVRVDPATSAFVVAEWT
jgi:predicted kinase